MSERFEWLDPDTMEPMVNIRLLESEPESDPLFLDIMQNGVEQSIRVRPHPDQATGLEYQVYAGRRRWRIVKRLKELGYGKGTTLDEDGTPNLVPWRLTPNLLPALIKEADDLEAERVTITENINREDVRPAEIGSWIKGMIVKHRLEFTKGEDREPTQSEIAAFFHRSQSWVSRILSATEMEQEAGVEIPTDSHYRALASMDPILRKNMIERAKVVGKLPSATELERQLRPGADPQKVLRKYNPLSGLYDDDFIAYQLMEECNIDTRGAKKLIFDYKMEHMSRAAKGKAKPDNVYTKLANLYPLWVQNIMMEYLKEAKSFDTIQRYAVSLIRHVWSTLTEEERQKILKEWIQNNF